MQSKYNQPNWVQWVTLVLALALVVSLFVVSSSIRTSVNEKEVDVPTANEIADALNIPSASEIADMVKIPEADAQRVEDVWNKVYEDEIDDLEDDAIDVCADEFDFDDLQDTIEDFLGEDISDLVFVEENEDERDIEVVNLGLDDEDDREVQANGQIRVKYKTEEGEDLFIFENVNLACQVTSDNGDLEADLTYSV